MRTYRAVGGQLLFMAAGQHVIEQSTVLWDVGLGLLPALATILIAVLWARPTKVSLLRRLNDDAERLRGNQAVGQAPIVNEVIDG